MAVETFRSPESAVSTDILLYRKRSDTTIDSHIQKRTASLPATPFYGNDDVKYMTIAEISPISDMSAQYNERVGSYEVLTSSVPGFVGSSHIYIFVLQHLFLRVCRLTQIFPRMYFLYVLLRIRFHILIHLDLCNVPMNQ